MNQICQSKATQLLSDAKDALCRMQLQKECDTTITLYDEQTPDQPMIAHCVKGTTVLPLWKLLAVVGIVAASAALLRVIFSLASLCSD